MFETKVLSSSHCSHTCLFEVFMITCNGMNVKLFYNRNSLNYLFTQVKGSKSERVKVELQDHYNKVMLLELKFVKRNVMLIDDLLHTTFGSLQRNCVWLAQNGRNR